MEAATLSSGPVNQGNVGGPNSSMFPSFSSRESRIMPPSDGTLYAATQYHQTNLLGRDEGFSGAVGAQNPMCGLQVPLSEDPLRNPRHGVFSSSMAEQYSKSTKQENQTLRSFEDKISSGMMLPEISASEPLILPKMSRSSDIDMLHRFGSSAVSSGMATGSGLGDFRQQHHLQKLAIPLELKQPAGGAPRDISVGSSDRGLLSCTWGSLQQQLGGEYLADGSAKDGDKSAFDSNTLFSNASAGDLRGIFGHRSEMPHLPSTPVTQSMSVNANSLFEYTAGVAQFERNHGKETFSSDSTQGAHSELAKRPRPNSDGFETSSKQANLNIGVGPGGTQRQVAQGNFLPSNLKQLNASNVSFLPTAATVNPSLGLGLVGYYRQATEAPTPDPNSNPELSGMKRPTPTRVLPAFSNWPAPGSAAPFQNDPAAGFPLPSTFAKNPSAYQAVGSKKPRGFWLDFNNFERELRHVMGILGTNKMPKIDDFKRLGYQTLLQGLYHHGGIKSVSRRLGL